MQRTSKRRRISAFVAAMATAVAGLAGLIVTTAAPAGAGINANTRYEIDCTTTLGASTAVSPFLVTANLNGAPDPRFPTGATFGASGALSFTVQGPQLSAFAGNGILVGGQIGLNVNGLTISSTDGTATGSYTYNHNFAAQAPVTSNAGAVSWSSGDTTLTGAFTAADIGGGLTGAGFANGTTIINVVAGVATLNAATTGAGSANPLLVYRATTYTDAAVSIPATTFTTNGVVGGQAHIGVTQLTGGFSFPGTLTVTFGTGGAGAGTNNCMLTGWQGATPGPAQTGNNPGGPWPPYAGTPMLPSVASTPLVLATGGFIAQPGTAQQITPPAAAFVTLADAPPVASNSTVNLGTGQSTDVTLSVSDTDPTPTTTCAVVGSPSDARLTVVINNTPSLCTAHLSDSGSVPQVVTFQFNATDGVGSGNTATVTVNIGTPPVIEPLNQVVNAGQLVLSCNSPETYLPGSPLLTCPNVPFAAITLNGLQQTRTAPGSTLYVSDNRGDPVLGWSLSAQMIPTATNPNASCSGISNFCNASVGSNAIHPSGNGQISKSNLALSGIGCAVHSGNLNPAPTAGAGGNFGSTLTLCTANAGYSGGTFDVTKTYTLTVPSSVYAGTYWGTVQYLVQ